MIDEKKLIEELEKQYNHLIPEDDTDYARIHQIKQDVKIIKSQPKVGEWIPVSEPPKEYGEYWVTNKFEDRVVVINLWYIPEKSLWEDEWGTSIYNVTHWTPIYKPEPYKEGEE